MLPRPPAAFVSIISRSGISFALTKKPPTRFRIERRPTPLGPHQTREDDRPVGVSAGTGLMREESRRRHAAERASGVRSVMSSSENHWRANSSGFSGTGWLGQAVRRADRTSASDVPRSGTTASRFPVRKRTRDRTSWSGPPRPRPTLVLNGHQGRRESGEVAVRRSWWTAWKCQRRRPVAASSARRQLAKKFDPIRSPPQKSNAADPVGTNTIPLASSTAIPAQQFAPPAVCQASGGQVRTRTRRGGIVGISMPSFPSPGHRRGYGPGRTDPGPSEPGSAGSADPSRRLRACFQTTGSPLGDQDPPEYPRDRSGRTPAPDAQFRHRRSRGTDQQ